MFAFFPGVDIGRLPILPRPDPHDGIPGRPRRRIEQLIEASRGYMSIFENRQMQIARARRMTYAHNKASQAEEGNVNRPGACFTRNLPDHPVELRGTKRRCQKDKGEGRNEGFNSSHRVTPGAFSPASAAWF